MNLDDRPNRGLRRSDFRKAAPNGLGDRYNAYPHSIIWFRDRLFVGTTRANICMLKVSKMPTNLGVWPVDCPDHLYELDMRAQIWALDPATGLRELRFRSPMIQGKDGSTIPRDMGYRGMEVFQGESDPEPALYISTYASAKSFGPLVLRSVDGYEFEPVTEYGLAGLPITTIRTLTAFKGRLFTTPTGRAGGNPNVSNLPMIYETRDPIKRQWSMVNEPGFGLPDNIVIFEMQAFGDYLYAGTGNISGYQLWRTRAEGNPPYRWEMVLTRGAYRGSLNQGVVSMQGFKGALYVGGGIQNGGIAAWHGVGPAAPELVRFWPDGDWDLIVGTARTTPRGPKRPLSGYQPGFDNFFNGYFWRMGTHDGWLYLGTFDWSLMLYYAKQERWPEWFRDVVARRGLDEIIANHAGFDLYRSFDGENWLPVSTDGFGNPYNYGIRSFADTPYGLFLGTVNPFGPRVAKRDGDSWYYLDNPAGGCEIWQGRTDWPAEDDVDSGREQLCA
jgi:hypothetical protein